jgi:hypothetical protein
LSTLQLHNQYLYETTKRILEEFNFFLLQEFKGKGLGIQGVAELGEDGDQDLTDVLL